MVDFLLLKMMLFSGSIPNEHDSTDHLGIEPIEQQKVSVGKVWKKDFDKVSAFFINK